MAKRVVQECDLTKQEVPDGDEIVTITIKRSGKKSGRSYELSSAAAAKLEQQLVAGKEATLHDGWGFLTLNAPQTLSITLPESKPKKTLADLDNDESFVSEMKADVAAREERITTKPNTIEDSPDSCRHINKGRIQITLKDKKRFVYQACTNCREKIPVTSSEDRQEYAAGKLPPDTNIRNYDR